MEELKENAQNSQPKNVMGGGREQNKIKKNLFSSRGFIACVVGGLCLLVAISMVITLFAVRSSAQKADAKTNIEFEATQVEKEQKVLISWETDKSIEGVRVLVTRKGNVAYSALITDSSTLAKRKVELQVPYGKYDIEVAPVRNGRTSASKTKTVSVFTDEYVIAPLFATMPITYFTLQLDSITNNYTIPTFVWFERGSSWNYSEMPENVYIIPVANGQDITGFNNIHDIFNETSAWIKELYEMNSNSKFHLYYTDILGTGVLDATVGNNIPTSAYDVVLITDGIGTYNSFNIHFEDAEDTQAVYSKMVETYNKLKQEIKDYGYYNTYSHDYCVNDEQFWGYSYVMAKEEPNVSWWITRYSGTMASNMQTQLSELQSAGKLKTLSMGSMIPTDEESQSKLKKLYNFSDSYFKEAQEQNKKALVILGTRTVYETNFADYVKAMKNYYGEGYVYYYKGHPGTPTGLDSEKQKLLEDLGLIDIDSSVAAELILLLNPDVYVAGYNSSTFDSVPANQCCGMFDKNYEDCSYSYKDKFDFFMFAVTSENEKYGSLVSGEKCYVLQFISNEKYDIAIYDAENNTMKFYKKSGETYSEVNK